MATSSRLWRCKRGSTIDLVPRIQACPFYTIIVDTTSDITRKDQVSIIVRWVSVEGEAAQIKESFLTFIHTTDATAKGLADLVNVVNEITQHAISFILFGTLVVFGTPHYDLWQPRQGPQMRYCLWAPECVETPLEGRGGEGREGARGREEGKGGEGGEGGREGREGREGGEGGMNVIHILMGHNI